MKSWMKHLRVPLAAAAIAVLTAVPALAAENPWFGTWKLDLAKSHLTGDTFTYAKQSDGLDQYSNGAMSYTFTANGIDYPVMSGETESWVFTGTNTWKVTDKVNGKVASTAEVKLSSNCKMMTTTTTGTRPDGTAFRDVETYTKEKGADGCLEGTWKSTKVSESAPSAFIISEGSSPDTMKWEIPGWKETVEGKLDGSDLPLNGPQVPAGMTVAFKADGSHKITYEVKANGKTLEESEMVLAPNGRSFTETTWTPGKENEKETAFFIKEK